jgi:hypothetical protein
VYVYICAQKAPHQQQTKFTTTIGYNTTQHKTNQFQYRCCCWVVEEQETKEHTTQHNTTQHNRLWLHCDWNELKRQNLCVYLYGMRRKCNVLDQMWKWSSECWNQNQKHPRTIDSSQLISLFNFKIIFRERESWTQSLHIEQRLLWTLF